MAVSLIRFHSYSEAATLTPGTTELVSFTRTRNPEQGPPYWLPDVPKHGYFDYYDGALVALYRDPDTPDDLWFQLGAKRVRLSASVASSLSPTFESEEPELENSSVLRRFSLAEDGVVVIEHQYTLNDREKRLSRGMDPFPAWPDEESNYDLCYLVHSFMKAGTWPQVLPTPVPPDGVA